MNQNIINKLGPLALGSRLKRLGEYIMTDGKQVYASNGIDFDPKWFPIVYTLNEEAPLGIMEIAARTGFAHPSVIAIVKDLEKNGLIRSVKDKADDRKRLIALTPKALKLVKKMEPLWKDISDSIDHMLQTHTNNLLFALEETEKSFKIENFVSRVRNVSKVRELDKVKIIKYRPSLKKHFKDLNYEWIEKYFRIEESDKKYLGNPEEYIIKKGGVVLFAEHKGEIKGTCALINMRDGSYEMSKMAVTEKARGKQIGKKLCLAAIEKARKLKAKKIFLLSNTSLEPAINLYKKCGFVPVNFDRNNSPYERSDIMMEIIF